MNIICKLFSSYLLFNFSPFSIVLTLQQLWVVHDVRLKNWDGINSAPWQHFFRLETKIYVASPLVVAESRSGVACGTELIKYAAPKIIIKLQACGAEWNKLQTLLFSSCPPKGVYSIWMWWSTLLACRTKQTYSHTYNWLDVQLQESNMLNPCNRQHPTCNPGCIM
jgi:hypothetical protein